MSTKRKKKTKKVVTTVAIILAIVLVAAVTLGIVTNWYRNWKPLDPTDDKQNEEMGGLILGESSGANGISLLSEIIPLSEYEEHGISPLAEKAFTLTAVILPEDAGNKLVDWTESFANASSSWASGKDVTDYVTVTPASDGALTASVECLQAFGEQIIITVTSRENSEVSACKPCDYVQTLTAYTVSLGDFNLISQTAEAFGTNVTTSAKMELGRYADGTPCVGAGGAVNATFEKSTVYTVENEFTVDMLMLCPTAVNRPNYYALLKSKNVLYDYEAVNITSCGVSFDRDLIVKFRLHEIRTSLQGQTEIDLSLIETKILISYYANCDPNALIASFDISITGMNFSISTWVDVAYDGYTNSTPVQDIQWPEDTPLSLLF